MVNINEGEHHTRVLENQLSIIVKLFMQNKKETPTMVDTHSMLATIWKMIGFKVIPIRRNYLHIFLRLHGGPEPGYEHGGGASQARGFTGVKVGTRFQPGHTMTSECANMGRQVSAQIWVRIYNLPFKYWKPTNIFNITICVDIPLRIHPKTIAIESGVYARVLVDIDCSDALPGKVLVEREYRFFCGY